MIITCRNEVVAKVMFLHVSVILFMGGSLGSPPPWDQADTPPQAGRTPPAGKPPWDQADPPGRENPPSRENPPGTRQTTSGRENPPGTRQTPRTRQTPPRQGETPRDQADNPPGPGRPPGRRLRHTVNERPVRILLECILVCFVHLVVITYFEVTQGV